MSILKTPGKSMDSRGSIYAINHRLHLGHLPSSHQKTCNLFSKKGKKINLKKTPLPLKKLIPNESCKTMARLKRKDSY